MINEAVRFVQLNPALQLPV